MCCEDWTCGECGNHVRGLELPRVCPECGTAGGAFVAATRHSEESADPEYLRRSWFEAGFRHPDLGAAVDPRLAP